MTNDLIPHEPKPDLDSIKAMVIDGLNSPHSKAMYAKAIDDFMAWYQERHAPGLTKATVNAYKAHLQNTTTYAPSTINLRLSAIRRLANEAAKNDLIADSQANGVNQVKGITTRGVRLGNWLTLEQAQALINTPDKTRLKGLRDRAILALMIGAGLRRSEVAALKLDQLQQRAGRWVIPDLIGKRKRVRTVPVPTWAKGALDEWITAANISDGYLFRPVNKGERLAGAKISSQTIQDIVKQYAEACGFELSAHDLRRTFAHLARTAAAPIDQIQFTLGHASVQTTERYLGTKQDLTSAPCDYIKMRLD